MMANVEIIKFQNEMIQTIKQEMRGGEQQPSNCNLDKVCGDQHSTIGT